MVKYKSNQPYYKLTCSGLGDDELQVLSFEGEEAISRLFEYRFELISKNPELEASDILNKAATFELRRGDEDPEAIHGIISHFEQHEQSYGKKPEYTYYKAILVPRFWRLTLNHKSVIFQKMDVKKLVTQVLTDAGMASDDYRFDLNQSYPEMDYVVQYRETDFDFVNRRLEHFGIFYYFDHQDGADVVVFTDSNDALQAIKSSSDLPYNPASKNITEAETIVQFSYQQKVVTGLVKLKDYNYRQPTTALVVEKQIDSEAPGEFYDYGEHYKDTAEGEFLAQIRNEEILCGSKLFYGTSDCKLLRTGFRFRLAGHYRTNWNAEMIITKLVSHGDQRSVFAYIPADDTQKFYENQFVAISMEVALRPPRLTPIPQIAGIMTARIESGNGDEYAFLDDQGQYKVKMHFDLSDASNGEASRKIRMSQPYSGPGYGIHFPNHADTEMVWSCIDGNTDRPLALGTVPNTAQSSPVTSNNKFQNMIRTAAGSEIVMDDKTDEAQITITTPDANKMLFDDKDDKIDIMTTNKHKVTFDDKNENITVQTTNGHLLIMDDKNTKITVQSKNGHRISINDTDGGENITLVDKDAKNTFVIDITNNKLVIKTDDGDIDFHAPNGTIDIKATTFNLETSGDTIIKADANINAEAGGDYGLKASGNITEEATGDLSQKGMNVNSEASMDFSIKGMNVKSEASIEHKISGTMVASEGSAKNDVKGALATVEASGITTIKGALVMIN